MNYSFIHQHPAAGAVLSICLGLLIRFIIGRRRFNRRGVAGLQLFSSYGKWWLTTRIEAILNFLALLMIGMGVFNLIFY